MSENNQDLPSRLRESVGAGLAAVGRLAGPVGRSLYGHRRSILALSVAAIGAYALFGRSPVENIERGEVGVVINRFTGSSAEAQEGPVLAIPGIHAVRRYSLRDQIYRPVDSATATGPAPFQTIEGLAVGVDITLRYALDPARIATTVRRLPEDIGGEVLQPLVQSVFHKSLTRYTVREIFSAKRAEIQQTVESELKALLDAEGIILKSVTMGKVDLPADYKAGMERLLAEELASDQMRFTLELKEKRIKENELEGEADKVRRDKAAEAAAEEQVIAAKAQAEAMKHILPFKQKQIEQRGLEAEAEKVVRIKAAEATAQARQIEAAGEAASRRKLADAEIYRLEMLAKTSSDQLARDGATITKNPLLVQKALADKLSDKISVIIAPPPTDGSFIAGALIGSGKLSNLANAGAAGNASPVREGARPGEDGQVNGEGE